MSASVFRCVCHQETPCVVVMLLPVGDAWFVPLCLMALQWWDRHEMPGIERDDRYSERAH